MINKSKFDYYKDLLNDYAAKNYTQMLREPDGLLNHKFIVPGSCYANSLWDWDSWLTDIALKNVKGTDKNALADYQKGCIMNFLDHQDDKGRLHITIMPGGTLPDLNYPVPSNVHKPCLAQHALFISENIGDFSWLAGYFEKMEKFIDYYYRDQRHESGLFIWIDDVAIGVDNDPSTFYRPKRSSASIYLNCLMYMELKAMAKISKNLHYNEKSAKYSKLAEELRDTVRRELWDERDGFYYSGDVNLVPIDPDFWLHSGCPRHWSVLIQRIDCWSGFMAMWAGIATKEQAERMVKRYRDKKTFNAPYGVRTLGKQEKQYLIVKSGNPSCWLGPIWGVSNWMVYEGLRNYGYDKDADELAMKHLKMLGKDIEKNGELHEYYDPETGVGVNNPGFQNWNLLGILMEIKG